MRKSEANYNMIDWWKKVVFENYANFSGRARRSEYWYFTLGQVCLWLLFYAVLLFGVTGEDETTVMITMSVFGLLLLATLLPTLAVSVRRLHDLGKSGGWYFLIFVPFGSIVLLVWFFTEGERFPNKYGDDPKNIDGPMFDFERQQIQ